MCGLFTAHSWPQVRVGFSHHKVDLGSEVCQPDKPLVFVLDVKPSKEEQEERAPKRQKKEKKSTGGKKDKKTKAHVETTDHNEILPIYNMTISLRRTKTGQFDLTWHAMVGHNELMWYVWYMLIWCNLVCLEMGFSVCLDLIWLDLKLPFMSHLQKSLDMKLSDDHNLVQFFDLTTHDGFWIYRFDEQMHASWCSQQYWSTCWRVKLRLLPLGSHTWRPGNCQPAKLAASETASQATGSQ